MTPSLITALIVLGIALVLFFLLREVNCWYFKINRHIELQEENNRLMRKLVEQTALNKTVDQKVTNTSQTSLNDPNVLNQLLGKLPKKD